MRTYQLNQFNTFFFIVVHLHRRKWRDFNFQNQDRLKYLLLLHNSNDETNSLKSLKQICLWFLHEAQWSCHLLAWRHSDTKVFFSGAAICHRYTEHARLCVMLPETLIKTDNKPNHNSNPVRKHCSGKTHRWHLCSPLGFTSVHHHPKIHPPPTPALFPDGKVTWHRQKEEH